MIPEMLEKISHEFTHILTRNRQHDLPFLRDQRDVLLMGFGDITAEEIIRWWRQLRNVEIKESPPTSIK